MIALSSREIVEISSDLSDEESMVMRIQKS